MVPVVQFALVLSLAAAPVLLVTALARRAAGLRGGAAPSRIARGAR